MGRPAWPGMRAWVIAATEHPHMSTAVALVDAGRALPPAEPARLRFAGFPITETTSFPPAPAAHCWTYVTLNAEIALSWPDSPALRQLAGSPRARFSIDGQWLWWALRRKYPQQALRKLSGSDLIHTLASHCHEQGLRLLLLGSTPALNARAVHALQQPRPGLAVAGYAPPQRGPELAGREALRTDALSAIAAFQPDYVVLGFGAAKEHALAQAIAPALDGRVRGLLCFGGAIDLASGRVRRAPRWCQAIGLEGPYRVWQQPQRLGRLLRVLRILPLLVRGSY